MKRLLIMRHAKSSWKDDQMADYDRPLNKRGKRDAPLIGRAIRDSGLRPDYILSSGALRARTTASLIVAEAGFEAPLVIVDRLYDTSPSEFMACLRDIPDDYACALAVGHNPTIEQLVFFLTGQSVTMPTAALATIDLPLSDWLDLDGRVPGQLVEVLRPRDLSD